MNIVVTGGAGFIGSHLCETLVGDGHNVTGIDNLMTGNRHNLAILDSCPEFTFIEHDVCLPWPKLTVTPDVIYHLASPASPIDYANLAIETLRVNSIGTLNALEVALRTDAKAIIASTSEVYGDPKISPQSETYWGNVNPIGQRSCYDEAKRFSEALAKAYERKQGVSAVIVRIFNTFGPRMRKNDGRVVPNFINQALSGQALTVYGDGSQTRSFCYVTDLVEALVKAATTGTAIGEVINLGNPEEMTIIDLASKVREWLAPEAKIVYESLPEDDPMQRRPDISKARDILGWEPIIGLEQGLRSTADWFRKQSIAC